MRGKFIVFEGLDGSGKTTQIKLLADRLCKQGYDVHITAEPTTSLSGSILRDVLSGASERNAYELATLFAWDRIHHNTNAINGIEKLLAEGKTVICDRYYYSSIAYQGAITDFEWVRSMNADCPAIRKPDLCIFLDLSASESMERIRRNRSSIEIFEKEDSLTRIREAFKKTFSMLDDNVVTINASGTPDQISETIYLAISKHFSTKND